MFRTPFTLLASGALAVCAFGPALAQTEPYHQTDPNQPANDGSAAASMTVPPGQVAPGVDPGTAGANGTVNNAIAANQMNNAANQGQYALDRAAYDKAMRDHGRQVAMQDSHYMHQQEAYAAAMEAWRANKYACEKKGHISACNAPTPDPADYY